MRPRDPHRPIVDAAAAVARSPPDRRQVLAAASLTRSCCLRLQLRQTLEAAHRRAAGRSRTLVPSVITSSSVTKTFRHQRCKTARQQLIEVAAAVSAKLRQQRVIDADPAADPAIDRVLHTQPIKRPRRTRSRQSSRTARAKAECCGSVAGLPRRFAARLDAIVQRRQGPEPSTYDHTLTSPSPVVPAKAGTQRLQTSKHRKETGFPLARE